MCWLQNPVVTAIWLTAMSQLLIRPLTLVADVNHYCQSPLHSKSFLGALCVWAILITLGMTAGPAHRANVFHLFLLPQVFRWQQLAFLLAASVLFGVAAKATKFVLARHQRQRVAPALLGVT